MRIKVRYFGKEYYRKKRDMTMNIQFLDTIGKTCPIPLFLTNSRLKQMSHGERLEVVSDCASLLPDLMSIFHKRCRVLKWVNENSIFRITLQKT
ncbi:MAG: sulfurtransferase TusA family protein [ANME-2 cluster archaeon]|nr:sulfurtransferase TusA family protein [ANME-2 cluster archaeon]